MDPEDEIDMNQEIKQDVNFKFQIEEMSVQNTQSTPDNSLKLINYVRTLAKDDNNCEER